MYINESKLKDKTNQICVYVCETYCYKKGPSQSLWKTCIMKKVCMAFIPLFLKIN